MPVKPIPSLSARLRPDVEVAPWVIPEVKKLEADNASLRSALEAVYNNRGYIMLDTPIQNRIKKALGK